ncbi:MAG TPA: twin-arginine translocation signal domain-containing protein, partial [Candidatus Fraserbacteria bacterium]|nr:twin-arginine translocation signal domain-containing protein [Candidatus Fraserbacteria bacterium]
MALRAIMSKLQRARAAEVVLISLSRRSFLQAMGVAALATALPRTWVWGAQSLPTLRLSLAPQIDSFPIVFGQDKGFFQDQGVALDLQGIGKLNERNLALFTG